MNNIIFARTRHHYAPYDDFYRLAELSGYPIKYLSEIDWWDKTATIITPIKHPEWATIPEDHFSRFIWWNLERGIHDAPEMDMSNTYTPPYVNEVWASDRAYAKHLGAKYVFLGGHRAFGSVDVLNKQYDIVTLMYLSGRRQPVAGELQGYRIADKEGGLWGEERHQRLMQSRLMVCAHQDEKPYCEPIRLMIAGCYALPVLSEDCDDSGYWQAQEHYFSASLGELGIMTRLLLQPQNNRSLARMGAAAWRLCCIERPFAQEVEAAL